MDESETYIGVKLVSARPMTRGGYGEYLWDVPADEDIEPGYLVEYHDGGKPNDERHEGYVTWIPKEQFENAYRPVDGMPFGHAIEAAKRRHKIARRGWNDKDTFIVYMPTRSFVYVALQEPGAKQIRPDVPRECQQYFAMFSAQEQWVPGWVPSQSDMFADDWYIVTEE